MFANNLGNKDPIVKILGDTYATVDRKDSTLNRLVDKMLKVILKLEIKRVWTKI